MSDAFGPGPRAPGNDPTLRSSTPDVATPDLAAGLAGAGGRQPLATGLLGPVAGAGIAPAPAAAAAGGAGTPSPSSGLAGSQAFLANHFTGLPQDWLAANASTPLLSSVQGPGGLFFNVPAVTPQGTPIGAGQGLTDNATTLGWQNFQSYPTMDAASAASLADTEALRKLLASRGAGPA